ALPLRQTSGRGLPSRPRPLHPGARRIGTAMAADAARGAIPAVCSGPGGGGWGGVTGSPPRASSNCGEPAGLRGELRRFFHSPFLLLLTDPAHIGMAMPRGAASFEAVRVTAL